ncbi:MAG TPA: hypothetical protein EYG21_07205 [Nitrospinaceae bacterium]|jgi:hypothetical protein|nr:hypothetical protein [Nitrospinaceae bacterium]
MTSKRKITAKRKVVKKTTAKVKKKEMIQTHAMEEKESFEKTTLDQVWGDKGSSRYGTLDEGNYSNEIGSLNRSDLHSHAVKMGILPIDNRELLTSRLMREFRKHVLAFRKPKRGKQIRKGLSGTASSILSEGK